MYITNKEIINILSEYFDTPNKKESKDNLYKMIKLMADKNCYRKEFIGYTRLYEDMVSNTYFYFYHNLKKGNIKLKNIKPGQITNTTKEAELKSQEIVISKVLEGDKFQVRRIKNLSKKGNKVKKFEYLDEIAYIIHLDDIKFNDCFAYITSIITTSFWKIIGAEKQESRKHQMIFNLEVKNNEYISTNDVSKYDFTNESEKEIIERMMRECIDADSEVKEKQERVRTVVIPKKNIWNR